MNTSTMTRPTFLLIALCLSSTACGDDQAPDEGRALYERIQSENYESFQTAPGYDTTMPSQAPHSDHTQIFVNSVVADALASETPITEWPVGSLIVKNGYDSDMELDIIAAMDKRDDGWFWAEWLDHTSSESDFSGKPDTCISCHEAGDDFVQGFGFPGSE